MTKYGLRARVFTLTLAPTLIIGLLLSAFFTMSRYRDLEHQLISTGASIIEPLAISTEYGMTDHNREAVRRLISYAHRKHSQIIRSIAVFDANNELFVTSNFHRNFEALMYPDDQPIPLLLETRLNKNSLILRAPILKEGQFNNPSYPGYRAEALGYIALELDLSALRLQQYQEVFTALMVLLLGLSLSSLFAYRLMKDVTRPISHMVSVVDRIRRGHLDVRIEGQLLGELDTLKNGINAMAVSLSEYHIEMQQSIDQATSDLRETLEQLEIQNVELDIAKKRAQEAARVKSEFLANMSHELRTPLNGVIGFTRQMLKTRLSTSQQDYLQTIEKSANNLLTIINDILDFSKLEAGKLLLENIPFDFTESLDEVMKLLAPSAHEKGLELTLKVDNRIPTGLIGDPLRIQQVLTNLIGNAVKFTERGNIDVYVELKTDKDENVELQFMVRDTGIGISERQQAQLFQAFSQADASISRRYGGTGLGLVITQKLVTQMGGEISLTSRLHQGSTFWFSLRLAKTDLPVSQPIDTTSLTDKKLLLIEPNMQAASVIQQRLIKAGLHVTYRSTMPDDAEHHHFALLNLTPGEQPPIASLLDMVFKAEQLADKVMVSLPTTELALSERLVNAGVTACLPKPLAHRKLLESLISEPDMLGEPEPQLPEPADTILPLTVMAVDDNPANLKLISALLSERAETVITATGGRKAVEYAHQKAFDLIFMDIQMPEMDGVTASQEIHKTELNHTTPVIAVTAHAMAGERERLINAGMDDYLTKPIEEHILQQILAKWTHPQDAGPNQPMAEETAVTKTPAPAIDSNVSWDWDLALKQAAGKEDLAKDMLQMLLDYMPEVEMLVNEALDGKHIELWPPIHKLHGSCAYSGVPRLKNLCYTIETELKAEAPIEDIEPELYELIDEMNNVVKASKAYRH
ncbi:two-component sensor histidine kinase BarA [uncultured Photobacterium sp.]|uniref:two-component sensor histidine kinase BarA n=1 Tax=uncultured Photobacterium sp. TaxID=173973 RepID=UPI0026120DCD|nr:two-component sensor histidine kinase BarA [uncultured Photobacterium sp.]